MSHIGSRCALIVVNYNGRQFLQTCFEALNRLDYPRALIDLIMIDNGSQDDSIAYMNHAFPAVRIVSNTTNNFARALNLGIRLTSGEYVGFINTDAQLDTPWLAQLVAYLHTHPGVGVAGGKIYLPDGRINSVGHHTLPHYYWEDMGFGEVDTGQYDTIRDVEGLCWAAVLFRRACLQHVGPIDEDFVMYFEDVEYARRCRLMGWTLSYVPTALAQHVGGGSGHRALRAFFANRNRFLYLAKHEPEQLALAIDTSVFWRKKQYIPLYQSLLIALKKVMHLHPAPMVQAIVPALRQRLLPIYGQQCLDHLFARLQVVAGERRPTLAIHDHALHEVGKRQHDIVLLASLLQDRLEITLLAPQPVTLADLASWYGVNLSRCHLEHRSRYEAHKNVIRATSSHYDIFLTTSAIAPRRLLSPIVLLVQCHDRKRRLPPVNVDQPMMVRVYYHEIDLRHQHRAQRTAHHTWSLPTHQSPAFKKRVINLFDTIYQAYGTIDLPNASHIERESLFVSLFKYLMVIYNKKVIYLFSIFNTKV